LRQLADYDAHKPGRIFTDTAFSPTIAEAYELQMLVAGLRVSRGESIAGYKIGCISEAVQRQLGINQPVFGHLFATEVYRSGAALDAAHFECLAIEGEFAVRAARDIPDAAWLREHPLEAIASVFPVIELHNNVFRRRTPTAEELIANNALQAGIVLPAMEIPLRNMAELSASPISVLRCGELLGTAVASALPGGPMGSLLDVVGYLASRGLALRRNQIVLTGSPLPLYPAGPGDHILVESPGVGKVEVIISTGRRLHPELE
jgi:2-keto-4-pentenoate hydratase